MPPSHFTDPAVWNVQYSCFDAVFHSIAFSLDKDRLGMMEQAVQDGGGEDAVVVEDFRPLFEGPVGGDNHGPSLVAVADDLKEQVGSRFIDGQVSQLVEDEQVRPEIFFEFHLKPSGVLSGTEGIDHIDSGGK